MIERSCDLIQPTARLELILQPENEKRDIGINFPQQRTQATSRTRLPSDHATKAPSIAPNGLSGCRRVSVGVVVANVSTAYGIIVVVDKKEIKGNDKEEMVRQHFLFDYEEYIFIRLIDFKWIKMYFLLWIRISENKEGEIIVEYFGLYCVVWKNILAVEI